MSDAEQVKERIQLVRALSNEMAAYLHTMPDNICAILTHTRARARAGRLPMSSPTSFSARMCSA